MLVEFRYTVRRYRGQIIGWGLGLTLYSMLMVSMYSDIAQIDFAAFLEYYPQDMLAFFGDSMLGISTPQGFLDLYFFNYMTIILGILAVSTGAKLLVKDEEDGILDLVLSYPKSRSGIFWGRVLSFLLVLVAILAISWLNWAIPSESSGLGLSPGDLLKPFLGLLGQLLLFGSFALLLSLTLPAARLASMVTGGLLVANYLLIGLSNINQDLEKIIKYTPLNFYQGGYAVLGINGDNLIIVFEVIVLFLLLAWWRFLQRDLRVAGEGGWKLMNFLPKKHP